MSDRPVSVLMVCLGNICRSPTAEGVLRSKLEAAGLGAALQVDSAGTSNWHEGEEPDSRSMLAASARGYDLSSLRARQVVREDFMRFDYILAMDMQNFRELQRLCPASKQLNLGLFLDHGNSGRREVPDPYEGGRDGFEIVLDLVEDACDGLLRTLIERHRLSPN